MQICLYNSNIGNRDKKKKISKYRRSGKMKLKKNREIRKDNEEGVKNRHKRVRTKFLIR